MRITYLEPLLKKEDDKPPQEEKPSAASIFGQAKPVDTAAREREIEQRLEKEKGEKEAEKAKPSKLPFLFLKFLLTCKVFCKDNYCSYFKSEQFNLQW